MKSIFALGIGSNFFTLAGIAVGMVVLGKTGWVDGLFGQIWMSLCLAPVFMGDAVNAYVLGRIRLEGEKGWDDVQITPEGRAALGRFHRFWRTLSFLSALMLGLILLTSLAPDPSTGQAFQPLFLALFLAHACRCLITIQTCYVPRVPMFGGSWLARRAAVTGAIFGGWMLWLWMRPAGPFSSFGFLFHGTVYFLLCATLQPLPSKFSVLARTKAPVQDLSVHPLPEGIENPAEKIAISQAAAWWKAETSFASLGFFRMPLLELPLFSASGEAFRSSDGRVLALLLISEVRPRVHRTLVSRLGDEAVVTTDFGAPDARFPEGIRYGTAPADESDAAMLERHRACLPPDGAALEDPPWEFLAALGVMMLQFLAQKTPRPSGSDSSPQGEPAGSFSGTPSAISPGSEGSGDPGSDRALHGGNGG